MATKVTIIGAGPAGYQAAIRAAQLGGQVTLVEEASVGGTCLHWGCIPTKALKATAEALARARRLEEYGITSDGQFTVDMDAVRRRQARVVDDLTSGIEKLLKAHGVEVVQGRGRLEGPGQVSLAHEQGTSTIASDAVILASGSRPGELKGLETDGQVILNSNHLLMLEQVPESLAVVGGGVVGCELAQIMAALGCRVTVIEALERLLPLPNIDPDLSKVLTREMKKQKIAVHTAQVVSKLERTTEGAHLTLGPSPLVPGAKDKQTVVEATKVLVSVGRRLNDHDLGLEQAGVQRAEGGAVAVDAFLRTNLAGVYAVGDLLGPRRPMLAHMAGAEGVAAAAGALGLGEPMSYGVVPSAIFTFPEVGTVGIGEAQAAELGYQAQASVFQMRTLGRAQAGGEIAGFCKLVSRDDGRLLGAQIIGARASDLIAECALALKLGATVGDLAGTIHAHPTLAEAVHEAAEDALGLGGLHSMPAKRK